MFSWTKEAIMHFRGKTEANERAGELRVYDEQIARIRQKLLQAAQAEGSGSVFGASSHQYRMNEPLTLTQLGKLEAEWGVTLPDPFAAFLVGVGDGGAGPYYGIYPSSRISPDLERLAEPSTFRLDRTSQDWMSPPAENDELDDMDDETYDAFWADLLRGTIEFGTMGCDNELLLIVSGEHRGRVVYINMDSPKSFFAYEKNFLDWYERWLDEVIGGFEIHWFGTTPGGGEADLVAAFRQADSGETRGDLLRALLRLPRPSEAVISLAEAALGDPAEKVRHWALTLLAKRAPRLADPLLVKLLRSESPEERRTAVQLIHWYRKEAASEFVEELIRLAPIESDAETFRFIGYVLETAGIEKFPLLLPAFRSPDPEIRKDAVWQAGNSDRKAEYVEEFIEALGDPDPWVQHTAVQATNGLTDLRLLPAYERLLVQHRTDEYYIPGNIRQALAKYEFGTSEEIERGVPTELTRVRRILRALTEERT
ncbi:hypothetical protein B9G55_04170 [Saccharibacillus sp. O16]|nr:hypothetical protein B9G55_04170 [Saccharibacillus sp. O16]